MSGSWGDQCHGPGFFDPVFWVCLGSWGSFRTVFCIVWSCSFFRESCDSYVQFWLLWYLPLVLWVFSLSCPGLASVCSQLCLVVNVKFLFLSCLHGSLFLALCPSLSLSILRSRFLPVSQYLVSLIWGCSLLTKFSSITWYFVSMFVVSVPLEKKKSKYKWPD